MSMFKKRPTNQYNLDVKTYSVDAPKIIKPKRFSKLKKILASSLIMVFATMGVSSAVIIPAQADTNGWCIIDAGNNEWVGYMGGLFSSQLEPAKSQKSIFYTDTANKAPYKYPTMRDRYGEAIQFVTWISAFRTNDGVTKGDGAKLYKGVEAAAQWAYDDRVTKSESRDGAWNRGTEYEPLGSGDPIRISESNDNGFVDLNCMGTTVSRMSQDILPNFLFQMAKGVSNVTTFLYVSASSGSNITNVTGLNTTSTSTTFEGTLERKTQTEDEKTWAQKFGEKITEVLTGKNAAGQPTGTKGIYDTLYLGFLMPVILIGTVVVLVNAIRARAVKAVTGLVWMVIAIISGNLLLNRPMLIPDVVDGLVGTISSEVNSAIISTGAGNPGCDIPDEGNKTYALKQKREAKELECYIWYYTIYIPWVQGQFGVTNYDQATTQTDPANGSILFYDKYGILSSQGKINIGYASDANLNLTTHLGWPTYLLEYLEKPQAANVALTMNQAIKNDVGVSTSGGAKIFDGGDKIGAATLSLAVSLAAGIFVSVNSVLIIGYQIAMLMLLIAAPVFLLIGIIPSQLGRGIALRWAELVVGIAVKRMIIVILMALFIKMFLIVAGINGIGVGLQAIIFAILAFIGLTKRNEIMELFTGNINFGGNKNFGTKGVENIGSNLGTVASGLAMTGGARAIRGVAGGTSRAVKATGRGAANKITRNGNKKPITSNSNQGTPTTGLGGKTPNKRNKKVLSDKNANTPLAQKPIRAEKKLATSYERQRNKLANMDSAGRERELNRILGKSGRNAASRAIADDFTSGKLDLTPKAKKTISNKLESGVSKMKGAWGTVKDSPRLAGQSLTEGADKAVKTTRRYATKSKDFAVDNAKYVKNSTINTAKHIGKEAKEAGRVLKNIKSIDSSYKPKGKK